MEPKQCLAYATDIADFNRMQIVAKNILSQGQNRRVSRVSGNKTFFGLISMFKVVEGLVPVIQSFPNTIGLSQTPVGPDWQTCAHPGEN